jgi:hypothetical protein
MGTCTGRQEMRGWIPLKVPVDAGYRQLSIYISTGTGIIYRYLYRYTGTLINMPQYGNTKTSATGCSIYHCIISKDTVISTCTSRHILETSPAPWQTS